MPAEEIPQPLTPQTIEDFLAEFSKIFPAEETLVNGGTLTVSDPYIVSGLQIEGTGTSGGSWGGIINYPYLGSPSTTITLQPPSSASEMQELKAAITTLTNALTSIRSEISKMEELLQEQRQFILRLNEENERLRQLTSASRHELHLED